MYLRYLLIDHVRAASEQVVDDPADRLFIARYHLGRKDHDVALFNLYRLMLVGGYPRKDAHRFALTPGGDDHDLVVRKIFKFVKPHPGVLRYLQITEVKRNLRIGDD